MALSLRQKTSPPVNYSDEADDIDADVTMTGTMAMLTMLAMMLSIEYYVNDGDYYSTTARLLVILYDS